LAVLHQILQFRRSSLLRRSARWQHLLQNTPDRPLSRLPRTLTVTAGLLQSRRRNTASSTTSLMLPPDQLATKGYRTHSSCLTSRCLHPATYCRHLLSSPRRERKKQTHTRSSSKSELSSSALRSMTPPPMTSWRSCSSSRAWTQTATSRCT